MIDDALRRLQHDYIFPDVATKTADAVRARHLAWVVRGQILDSTVKGCFYVFMRTTVDFPAELFRKAKARAASRGESLKSLITRAVAAEVGHEGRGAPAGRVTVPLFGNPGGRRVDVRASDLARALAEDDVVRAKRRNRR